jgi:PAS domain S-box-containing protein
VSKLENAFSVARSLSDPVVVLDRSGRVVFANAAGAGMFGMAPSALSGRDFADLLNESPDDFRQKLRKWMRSRESVPGAIRLREDGAARKVSCEAAGLVLEGEETPQHVVLHCREHPESTQRFEALNRKIQELAREIRERQRTEQALRESEQRFRSLFEHASDAIVVANDRGELVNANPAACELLARPLAEVRGLSVQDLVAPSSREGIAESWLQFESTSVQTGTLVIVRPDGEEREVEYSASRNFVAGEHLSILRDVTERRAQERERARQAEALARSNAELEQFAYVASHDLQEPLRTISSFLQLVERRLAGLLDRETADFMRIVREAVMRQRQIILDLLEFSRLRLVEPARERVDLNETLEQILFVLKPAISEKGAEVSTEPLPEIEGDSTQLYQLLLNLVHNAVKFADERPRVAIRAERNGAQLLIAVSDNGPGIESDYFDSIFEPFKRLHGRDVPGSGIGLALCKRVAENHQGRIWVESTPGAGSTFWVALPFRKERATAQATRD